MMSKYRGIFEFDEASVEFVDGKASYPHMLYLKVFRENVADLIRELVTALEKGEGASVVLTGEMRRDPEQDPGNPF